MAPLGRAALIITLGLVVYAALAGGYAAWRGRGRLAESARNALLAAFAATAIASLVLVASFLRHDFSLTYVAEHSSRELPLAYTVAAFWSGSRVRSFSGSSFSPG